MGLIDKLNEKVTGGARGLIKGKLKSTIKKLIKEKRLVYLDNGMVDYTNRQGVKMTLSLDEMSMILVEASGSENLLSVGIMPSDVRNMLVEAKGRGK